jgi:hypothetical protein
MRVTTLDSFSAWKTTPGYQTLAIDGGAMRFECPANWTVAPTARYVCVADRRPPEDRCLLALSWRRIPTEATILSIPQLVHDLSAASIQPGIRRGPVIRMFRPPLELAWTELRFTDPAKKFEAGKRLCLARSGCTQGIAVFDFRLEDSVALFSVWNTFLRTLALGETIADACSGRRRERWG